ncbi:MAG: bifunctional nuclease family protein [Muribaculaceae bacterium]|nr:bifunctional nuclease family protein [Muribaculaceae bacterium]
MEDLYRLKLTGITYNQIESGVYALILEEEQSGRRLPIIIGYPEAQAIECKLQEIVTPRPLTHDLMVSVFDTFGISLKSVVIRKLPNGVFAADLTLQNEETIRTVDARSSDAVALAIRVGAPIYTTSEVLDEASYLPEEKQTEERTRPSSTPSRRRQGNTPPPAPEKLSDMPDSMLAQLMQKAVEEENYEEAAKIKSEIERRKE